VKKTCAGGRHESNEAVGTAASSVFYFVLRLLHEICGCKKNCLSFDFGPMKSLGFGFGPHFVFGPPELLQIILKAIYNVPSVGPGSANCA
jgi:hypothetical protein